eukprot:CAMPEP_0113724198 /NCGR_PEP_ID=MMETSP0038_2-20120614/38914_1 /TAXON_ID=2898 /ORGANISM="Cryptomonas paramecium" /LENGTH=76 /DNA_ID=CAMNT_0000654009 /DNA_START=183 /DNA_END=410 /DNA_ORIENTATION=- /assembly_acc=CAM_ASM_000170
MIKKYDLKKWIRFNTAVRHIDYDESKKVFQIRVEDTASEDPRISVSEHDYVIIANGHFSVPNLPTIEGLIPRPHRT